VLAFHIATACVYERSMLSVDLLQRGYALTEEKFHALVHRILVGGDHGTIDEIAEKLEMKPNNLYARLRGNVKFSAHEIRLIFEKFEHTEVIDYFLKDTNYFLAPRPSQEGQEAASWEKGAIRTHIEVADVVRAIEDGLEDHKMDHQDKAKILKEIEVAEGTLTSLRKLIASKT